MRPIWAVDPPDYFEFSTVASVAPPTADSSVRLELRSRQIGSKYLRTFIVGHVATYWRLSREVCKWSQAAAL